MNNTRLTDFDERYKSTEFGIDLLGKIPILKGFTQEQLGKLYASGEIRIYDEAANIVIEGEQSAGMYIIIEGLCGVFKGGGSAVGSRLTTLSQGKSFGEMSLIDKQPRSASVVADGRAILYHLDDSAWQELLKIEVEMRAQFYENGAQILASRLREMNEDYILSQRQLWKLTLLRMKMDKETA